MCFLKYIWLLINWVPEPQPAVFGQLFTASLSLLQGKIHSAKEWGAHQFFGKALRDIHVVPWYLNETWNMFHIKGTFQGKFPKGVTQNRLFQCKGRELQWQSSPTAWAAQDTSACAELFSQPGDLDILLPVTSIPAVGSPLILGSGLQDWWAGVGSKITASCCSPPLQGQRFLPIHGSWSMESNTQATHETRGRHFQSQN